MTWSFEDFANMKALEDPGTVEDKIKSVCFTRGSTESARKKANTSPPYLVALDFDAVRWTLEEATGLLEANGVDHIAWTTHSHGKLIGADLSSFRIVTDYYAETWGEVADITDQLAALFPDKCKPAPESWTTLVWFAPVLHPRREDYYEWVACIGPDGSTWSPERNVEAVAAIDAPRPKSRREPAADLDIAEIESALEAIPNEDLHYDEWLEIGMALHNTGALEALDLWQDWSAKSPKHDADYCEGKWESFSEGRDDAVTLGTIFHYAKQNGWEGHIDRTPSGGADFDAYTPEAEAEREPEDDDEPSAEEKAEERVRWKTCLEGQNRRAVIHLMNERLAYVMKAGIVLDTQSGSSVSFIKPNHFQDAFIHPLLPHPTKTDKDGEPVLETAGKIWFLSENRRSYESIDFLPLGGPDRLGPDVYNQWRGWACEPEEGDGHLPLIEHIHENICSGNEEWARWVIAWMAHLVQKPYEKPGTALVLRSTGEGTGKGVLGNAILHLTGEHGIKIDHTERLTGRFNAHLYGKIFVFADEVTWGGNRKDAGFLRSLVTEPITQYEEKNVPAFSARSFSRLFLTGNDRWLVPAGPTARRWQVFDVSELHMQDRTYFGRVVNSLVRRGHANLLNFLLELDLADYPDPCKTLTTQALVEQKTESFDSLDGWIYGILWNGYFTSPHADLLTDQHEQEWPKSIAKNDLFICYKASCGGKYVRHADEVRVGKRLREVFGSFVRTRRVRTRTGREYVYDLPPLDVARKCFSSTVTQADMEWPDEPDPEETGE